jgi:hypothetical protein
MRAFAVLLLGMVSACRHAPPETEPRVRDVSDFCCTAANCCGVRYFDEDGGVHVQPCGPRKQASGRVPPESLQAWLLPDDGGSEEPAEASPKDAPARSQPPPQPEFVVYCERAPVPRNKPMLRWYCHRHWSDGGISPCEALDSCL